MLKAAGALDVVGVLAALAATASMSAGTVLTKRWGRPEGVGPLALTGWQLTAGGLLIAPVALLVEGAPPALDGRAVGGYLYLALANTAVAYWLWFRGIGRLTATRSPSSARSPRSRRPSSAGRHSARRWVPCSWRAWPWPSGRRCSASSGRVLCVRPKRSAQLKGIGRKDSMDVTVTGAATVDPHRPSSR